MTKEFYIKDRVAHSNTDISNYFYLSSPSISHTNVTPELIKEHGFEKIERDAIADTKQVESIRKTIIFSKYKHLEIRYYRLGDNEMPHLSICGYEFNKKYNDFEQIGQCQEEITKGTRLMGFVEKWNPHHLHSLTLEEYEDLKKDIDNLLLFKLEIKGTFSPVIIADGSLSLSDLARTHVKYFK